jgi:hypothetical protein
MMGDIYRRATTVVVWLGESDPATDKAFQDLLTLGHAWRAMGDTKEEASLREIHRRSDPMMNGISRVFQRPWFYRLWTVQEMTLPDVQNVLVYCGSFNYPWFW